MKTWTFLAGVIAGIVAAVLILNAQAGGIGMQNPDYPAVHVKWQARSEIKVKAKDVGSKAAAANSVPALRAEVVKLAALVEQLAAER